MIKVRVMLLVIALLAIGAGIAAFEIRVPIVCAYSKTLNTPGSTTIGSLTHVGSVPTFARTTMGSSTQFGATYTFPTTATACPQSSIVTKFRTLVAED